MACIKPPLNVTSPPARAVNRLAFVIDHSVDPSVQRPQPSTNDLTNAQQSADKALLAMSSATSGTQIDNALKSAKSAKSAIERALRNTSNEGEKKTLRAALRNLEQRASTLKNRMQVQECIEAGFPASVVTASASSTAHQLAEGYALVGSKPRGSEHAGSTVPLRELGTMLAQKYPDSVTFTAQGFPDFAPYAVKTVRLDKLTGNRAADFQLANALAGLERTPSNYTWHHVEDGHTLVLIPTDLHQSVPHTGGIARHANSKRIESTFTIAALGSIMNESNSGLL